MDDPWVPEQHGEDQRSLQRRVARGLSWTFVHSWSVQLLNFLVFIILARLLAPPDFGLVALATVFVAFSQLIVDQGLGDALVQRRALTRSHLDTAFWVALGTGTLLTLVAQVLAGPIAAGLNEPELEPMLRVLSLTFMLAAMISIHTAILQRELQFLGLALRAIAAAIAGGVVGVTMAVIGFGAWSLIGQQVTVAIVSVLVLWRVSPWRPTMHVSRSHFGELFSFGINVVGSDTLTFLSRNADRLLIGIFLGTGPLGLYTVGYRMLETTTKLLITVARRIAFPAFARLQADRERLRRAYMRVIRVSSAVILPGYVGLAVVAPELTVLVFGTRWESSGSVAALLFLIGPVVSFQAFSGSLLQGVGRPDIVLRFRLITTVVNVIGFLIAVRFGILAVAAAYVVRWYLLLPLNLYWSRKYAGIPIRGVLLEQRGTALATGAMVVAMLLVKVLLGGDADLLVLLVGEAAAGAVMYLGTLWLVERAVLVEVFVVATQAVPARTLARRALRRRQSDEMQSDGAPASTDDL